ncbi:uncharacterized protein [Parasteatoda tepidariorum]|uniref:uncharacterized protein n=1 Tax=Parasteatoda tepidariorum TaxID=114398 RepID=UPI0039BD102C
MINTVFESIDLRILRSTIERIPLLSITKTYKTTSTNALQVLAGTVPLDLIINTEEKMANIYFHESDEDPYAPLPDFPPIHPAELKSINFGSNLPTKVEIEIFTDGSRLIYNGEYKVGCAFVIYADVGLVESRNFRLTDYSTVFKAELWVIFRSLHRIHQNNINSETNIYSDSHSSLQALSNTNTNDYLVQIMKKTYKNITEFH